MTVRFGEAASWSRFDASAAGLGITEATWTTGGDMNADITLLESALARLRRGSADMSNNLSIITARQTFSEMMENILTEGSDRLTLADTSEEGANMLMLQTRQSLSMNVLSLSADAAQSVLQLFQVIMRRSQVRMQSALAPDAGRVQDSSLQLPGPCGGRCHRSICFRNFFVFFARGG
jgi:hypothetical protein